LSLIAQTEKAYEILLGGEKARKKTDFIITHQQSNMNMKEATLAILKQSFILIPLYFQDICCIFNACPHSE